MVELVHSNHPPIKRLYTVFVHGEAERRMRADQDLVGARQKCRNGLNLSAVIATRRVAEVPVRHHVPVGPKAVFTQWLIVEASTNSLLRHDDNCLPKPLVGQLIEGDEI